jgi:hypothetical protein
MHVPRARIDIGSDARHVDQGSDACSRRLEGNVHRAQLVNSPKCFIAPFDIKANGFDGGLAPLQGTSDGRLVTNVGVGGHNAPGGGRPIVVDTSRQWYVDRPCATRIAQPALPGQRPNDEFLFVFRELCSRRLAALEPDAVVITCGADTLKGDPLSSMAVSNHALSHAVAECTLLLKYALVLGGGGYNPWTTARLWARLWAQMNGLDIPQHLPLQAHTVLQELSCDLIDQEDVDPEWLSSIADRGNPGPIRTACLTLAETACEPSAGGVN